MKLLYMAGLLLLFVTGNVRAQDNSCPFDRFIKDALELAKKGKSLQAKAKFKSAITCRPYMLPEIEKMIHDMRPNNEPDSLKGAGLSKISTPGPGRTSDSIDRRIRGEFLVQNPDLIKMLSPEDRAILMADVDSLWKLKRVGQIDSLKAFFQLLYQAKTYNRTYQRYAYQNSKTTGASKFPDTEKNPLSLYSLQWMDVVYYSGRLDLELAAKVLPAYAVHKYKKKIASVVNEIDGHRHSSLLGYRMPDTVVGLPAGALFSGPSSDNRNFAWGYSDYSDYKKLQVRYLNMSLPDFAVTTDSAVSIKDSGMFYSMSATAGDYKFCVGRGIDYKLRPNMVEYHRIDYADPPVERIVDSERRVLMDLTGYASNSFFFSSDASHLSGWKDGLELVVLDVRTKEQVPLKNAKPAPTETYTPDSKSIAYYNDSTQIIYHSDLSGTILEQIPGKLTGIDHISNIDFTGGDAFLKVNNNDSVSLFNVHDRKMVARFSKTLVSDLVVSPDGTEILLTCNKTYRIGQESYQSWVGILTDLALNIKERLYSDCSSFFFTPEGDYIVGYGDNAIMRWPVVRAGSAREASTCLSPEEFVKYKCLPLSGWAKITNADLVENGVRAFMDQAHDEEDSMLQQMYYRESAHLIYELVVGNARLKRWERVPFFYSWYSWVEWKMGNKELGNQFVKEFTAVREFDKLINSSDSIYPQQLYYAAEENLLLENLYDSLRMYNVDLIELTEKEIALRYRVFQKDPENISSTNLLIKAFQRLSVICDSVGWRDLQKGRYAQRLTVYTEEERLLERSMAALPDSFGLKPLYINAMAHLAPSFLYQYASHGGKTTGALDSALYYSEKGLALSSDPTDSARLLTVKACAFLLQPGESEKSMALCRQVRHDYPRIPPRVMLNQLAYLREAGAKKTSAMERIEEFLKAEEK